MTNFKSSRTAEDMKREITALIRELKDPRITSSSLTVVRVEVTSDLSFAKVYVSSMDGMETAQTAVKALQAASGFIRRELGVRLKIRKAPEIKFIADDSVVKTIEMFAKLKKSETEAKDHAD